MEQQQTREQWLDRASALLIDHVISPVSDFDRDNFPKFRVSCGWPGTKRGRNSTAIGVCWPPHYSADETYELFISPLLSDETPNRGLMLRDENGHTLVRKEANGQQTVLDTLLHELLHVVTPGCGHRGLFAKLCNRCDLLKPYTATTPSAELCDRLDVLAAALGPYPHAQMSPSLIGHKQTTRLLKAICPDGCGYTFRITRKHVEESGLPKCPTDGVHFIIAS